MSKLYIFLADGFEEIEGLTVVDVLRRAGVEVTMVSVMGKKNIVGAHHITLEADALFENVIFQTVICLSCREECQAHCIWENISIWQNF